MTKQRRLEVAVIGCGPGGMFLAHAVESKRRELQRHLEAPPSANDDRRVQQVQRRQVQDELDRLPRVVLFEKSGHPGGVWKSKQKQLKTDSNDQEQHTNDANDILPNLSSDTSSSRSGASTTGSGQTTLSTSTTTVTNDDNITNTNMYEALWCNGPHQVMEFADYTFADHFGLAQQLPVYLPRQAVLDYLVGRVTRHCPHFFHSYAQFHTNVDRITYDHRSQQFAVTTTTSVANESTGSTTTCTKTELFDRVVWSAGQNGRAKIPQHIQDVMQDAHDEYYQQQQPHSAPAPPPPPFWHSSAVDQRLRDMIRANGTKNSPGVHVAILGGSYSAEDLALMVLKWGARRVTIIHRRHGVDVPVGWTRHWPTADVDNDNENLDGNNNNSCGVVDVCLGYEVHQAQVVLEQTNDTTRTSYTLQLTSNLHSSDEQSESDDESCSESDESEEETTSSTTTIIAKTITGVHVLLCCTGYHEDLDMLDPTCYNMTGQEYDIYWNAKDKLELPDDWAMPENRLSQQLADYCDSESESDHENHVTTSAATPPPQIPPRRSSLYPGCFVNPYSYRECLFVHNPNLMWLAANNFETPLLALDVQAQLCFQWIAGYKPVPTKDEMKRANHQQAVYEMTQLPMVRYWMDTNYYNVVRQWLSDTTKTVRIPINGNCGSIGDDDDDDHDYDDDNCFRTFYEYPSEWNACYAETAEYEMRLLARLMQEADYPIQLGSFHELNELGQEYLRTTWNCRNYNVSGRQTFRDLTVDQASTIQSLLTGSPAAPLRGLWLDVPEDRLDRVTELV